MKSEHVVNLVRSYYKNDKERFENTLIRIIHDEESKGNNNLAVTLRGLMIERSSFSTSSLSKTVSSKPQKVVDENSQLELVDMIESDVTLSDVALSDNIKRLINQVIKEYQNEDLRKKGLKATNRLILSGAPGCGKTMTAHAIAGELRIPIAYVRLDSLVSSYLGQTSINIRKIFDYVRGKDVLLFLDEFDAIAKKRDDHNELGELKRVVTTLLQNMDCASQDLFIIAATNHPHLLDPAIWRRFDFNIELTSPDTSQREKIIEIASEKELKGISFDRDGLVIMTEGMSGSDMALFIRMLAKHAVLNNLDMINRRCMQMIWVEKMMASEKDDEGFNKRLISMYESGMSLRTLEIITGIPKSTLSYRFGRSKRE